MFKNKLLKEAIVTNEELTVIYEQVLEEVEESVRFAEESPFPNINTIEEDVYA